MSIKVMNVISAGIPNFVHHHSQGNNANSLLSLACLIHLDIFEI
jgi:hypothetical protein